MIGNSNGRNGMNVTYKVAWVMWIGGTVLIAASWFNLVDPLVGWVGFAVAGAGTLLSLLGRVLPRKSRSRPHDEDYERETGPDADFSEGRSPRSRG